MRPRLVLTYDGPRKGRNPLPSIASVPSVDRPGLIDWYQRNRLRSRRLFDLIDPAAYYSRPITLRNPIVFYEGHLPAFSLISLVKRGLGRPGVDERLEQLFARGIDPDSVDLAVPRSGASTIWPTRESVLAFASLADRAIVDALEHAPLDLEGRKNPAMERGQAIYTALEHEAMHQETLLYMWHRLPHSQKVAPRLAKDTDGLLPALTYDTASAAPARSTVAIPAGVATLGADRMTIPFGWDNEFEAHRLEVPAFDIDVHDVTNADFLEFVEAGGYGNRELWSNSGWEWRETEDVRHPAFWLRHGNGWLWRGMFEDIPLPGAWPVYVSSAEADAYACWRGRRLPTEPEYHRAAYGTPWGEERAFPWGSDAPDSTRGNFDFASWEPVAAGSYPSGVSAWGVHDLIGNGWEWTSTLFAPFAGFEPMVSYPEYSAEFFDGQHYVIKGASPGTARELVRRSFRNWFRPNYPYVYASFRTAVS
jgi:gamma-glutamyl hercynylcysteine S-oxide synthase